MREGLLAKDACEAFTFGEPLPIGPVVWGPVLGLPAGEALDFLCFGVGGFGAGRCGAGVDWGSGKTSGFSSKGVGSSGRGVGSGVGCSTGSGRVGGVSSAGAGTSWEACSAEATSSTSMPPGDSSSKSTPGVSGDGDHAKRTTAWAAATTAALSHRMVLESARRAMAQRFAGLVSKVTLVIPIRRV